MDQFVGDINDNKVLALENILNYINISCHTKYDDSAINQHKYTTTNKKHFQDKTFKIPAWEYNDKRS